MKEWGSDCRRRSECQAVIPRRRSNQRDDFFCIRVRMKKKTQYTHLVQDSLTDGHGRTNRWTKPVKKKKFPRAEQQQKPTTTILCFRSFLFYFFQPRNRPELWIRKGSRRGSSEREIRDFLGEAKYTQRKRAGKQWSMKHFPLFKLIKKLKQNNKKKPTLLRSDAVSHITHLPQFKEETTNQKKKFKLDKRSFQQNK